MIFQTFCNFSIFNNAITNVVNIVVANETQIAAFVGKIGLDPAAMASPLITTLVYAISLIVYFFVASNILSI